MFYIALCDDEWQAVEILTGYLSEIKRSGLQLESVPFLNGREPVSYTHLDVYKRQCAAGAAHEPFYPVKN